MCYTGLRDGMGERKMTGLHAQVQLEVRHKSVACYRQHECSFINGAPLEGHTAVCQFLPQCVLIRFFSFFLYFYFRSLSRFLCTLHGPVPLFVRHSSAHSAFCNVSHGSHRVASHRHEARRSSSYCAVAEVPRTLIAFLWLLTASCNAPTVSEPRVGRMRGVRYT